MKPKTLLAQLDQLITVTWDGNLLSKDARDELVRRGLVQRHHGWNWLTREGIELAEHYKFLKT
jgi:hypothetical protein